MRGTGRLRPKGRRPFRPLLCAGPCLSGSAPQSAVQRNLCSSLRKRGCVGGGSRWAGGGRRPWSCGSARASLSPLLLPSLPSSPWTSCFTLSAECGAGLGCAGALGSMGVSFSSPKFNATCQKHSIAQRSHRKLFAIHKVSLNASMGSLFTYGRLGTVVRICGLAVGVLRAWTKTP